MKDINATVIISNLEDKEKKILKRLHKDARWGIKKAINSGLRIENSNSEQDWNEFYEIYKKIMKKGGTYAFKKEDLQKIAQAFLVCKKGKKVVGAGIIWFGDRYRKDIPRLHTIACDEDYWKYQPNNLIYWESILWAKRKDYSKFDFGGWQINPDKHLKGINKFKEKWGEVVIYKKEYPFFRALGRKIIRNSRLAKYFWIKIKNRK